MKQILGIIIALLFSVSMGCSKIYNNTYYPNNTIIIDCNLDANFISIVENKECYVVRTNRNGKCIIVISCESTTAFTLLLEKIIRGN